MFSKILIFLSKPFLGTGISQKIPFVRSLYGKLLKGTTTGTISVKIPQGISLTVQKDTGPGLFYASKGEFEPYHTELFMKTINPGDIVFDIGAHVGMYALVAAKIVGSKGKVVAYEPDPTNLEFLHKNISDNKIKNCIVVPKGVADSIGTKDFYRSPVSSGEHSLIKKQGTIKTTITTTTIDKESKVYGIPSVIQVDVEGAERQILLGANKTLNSSRLHNIFIEVSSYRDGLFIHQLLERHGFKLFLLNEEDKNIEPFDKKSLENAIKKYGFINLVGERV